MKTRIAIIIALMSISASAWADTSAERQFAWQAANWTLSSARSEAEFLKAADQYRELVREGVRNGPVFYNLGTALLNAERYDEALHYLGRAERYMGTTWEIERNMLVAIAKRDGTAAPSLPAHRILFFWHYKLASVTRAAVALLSFALIWCGLILRLFGMKRMKYVIACGLVAFALFGTSVAASSYQESRADIITSAAHE
jgi:tetratricopeptide (TPR) repeat protein